MKKKINSLYHDVRPTLLYRVHIKVNYKLNFEYSKCKNNRRFHAVCLQLSGRRTQIMSVGVNLSQRIQITANPRF